MKPVRFDLRALVVGVILAAGGAAFGQTPGDDPLAPPLHPPVEFGQTEAKPPAPTTHTPTEVDQVFQSQGQCQCQPDQSPFANLFKSDRSFEGFIEPVTNPVLFEDPRSRSRVRFIFMNQQIPEDSILRGGDFQVYAMQATVALNDRLSLIAQKDGYISLQADGLIDNQEGWADLGTGLKYVLIRDVENQFLLSTGIMYEWSQGAEEVFQGNGAGMWHFFVTSGKEFGDWHVVTAAGFNLPNDHSDETESMWYSAHIDRHLGGGVYALAELNGIHYTKGGRRLPPLDVEGGDLINLGTRDIDEADFLSAAFGTTIVFCPNVQAAAAWEFPITGRKDLMDNRLTATLSLIY